MVPHRLKSELIYRRDGKSTSDSYQKLKRENRKACGLMPSENPSFCSLYVVLYHALAHFDNYLSTLLHYLCFYIARRIHLLENIQITGHADMRTLES